MVKRMKNWLKRLAGKKCEGTSCPTAWIVPVILMVVVLLCFREQIVQTIGMVLR